MDVMMFYDITRQIPDDKWEELEYYLPLWLACKNDNRTVVQRWTEGYIPPSDYYSEEDEDQQGYQEWEDDWQFFWDKIRKSPNFYIAEDLYEDLTKIRYYLHKGDKCYWDTDSTTIACDAYMWLSKRTPTTMVYDPFEHQYCIWSDYNNLMIYRIIKNYASRELVEDTLKRLQWQQLDIKTLPLYKVYRDKINQYHPGKDFHSYGAEHLIQDIIAKYLKKYAVGAWMIVPPYIKGNNDIIAFESPKDATMIKLRY